MSVYKRGEPKPLETFQYEHITFFGASQLCTYKIIVDEREMFFETPLVRARQSPFPPKQVFLDACGMVEKFHNALQAESLQCKKYLPVWHYDIFADSLKKIQTNTPHCKTTHTYSHVHAQPAQDIY